MREISAKKVTETIADLLQDVCYRLPDDATAALRLSHEREKSPAARNVLAKLLENAEAAVRDEIPLCQDTGMAVVFLELGQDVHVIFTRPFRRARVARMTMDTCANLLWKNRSRHERTPKTIRRRSYIPPLYRVKN